MPLDFKQTKVGLLLFFCIESLYAIDIIFSTVVIISAHFNSGAAWYLLFLFSRAESRGFFAPDRQKGRYGLGRARNCAWAGGGSETSRGPLEYHLDND